MGLHCARQELNSVTGRIKIVALVGIVGVVQPETDVECVRRRQSRIRIETENLVEQDGLVAGLEVPLRVCLQIT